MSQIEEYLSKYPLLCTRVIVEAFHEVMPRIAAQAIQDARDGSVPSGYNTGLIPGAVVACAINNRRSNKREEIHKLASEAVRNHSKRSRQHIDDHEPRIRLLTTELVNRVGEGSEQLNGPETAGNFLCDLIGRKDREYFVAVHLNARHQVVSAETVAIGSLTGALVHPREVYKAAILNNAAAIICGHNHPAGDLTPSREDTAIYERLEHSGNILGINLLDFFIVNDSCYRSIEYS